LAGYSLRPNVKGIKFLHSYKEFSGVILVDWESEGEEN